MCVCVCVSVCGRARARGPAEFVNAGICHSVSVSMITDTSCSFPKGISRNVPLMSSPPDMILPFLHLKRSLHMLAVQRAFLDFCFGNTFLVFGMRISPEQL